MMHPRTLLLLFAALALAVPLRAAGELSVFGVRPGMTRSQVEGALGRPAVDSGLTGGGRVLGYRKGVRGLDDPRVWLDADGRVTFVAGSQLQRDGETLLERGATPEQILAALGSDATVSEDPGGATVCSYPASQVRAVLSGKPPRALVFGLGKEPSGK